MSKRAIITGATGFIGANLARRLLHDGHAVHVLARAARSEWRIAGIRRHVELHETDITDREGVLAAVKRIRPEWVFHLAAYGAYSHQTEASRIVSTNVFGCMAVLDACLETGVQAFVHGGSSSEYGYLDHPANERHCIAPNSVYAIGKAAATHYCRLIALKHDIHAVTLRLYSIYGPYEEPSRLIPTLLVHGRRGLLPPLVSPRTARDFVYVDDAIEAMVRVAETTGIERGSILNVCSGICTDMTTVIDSVRQLLGISAEPVWDTMPARPWDTNVWVGDPERMARATGWRATIPLGDGLRRTLDWLCESPERVRSYEQDAFGPKV